MRKLFFILFLAIASIASFAQTGSKKAKIMPDRAADHFMLQLGTSIWNGAPDSISNYIRGFNKSANVYFMYDKPFKSNPKFSIAVGLGVGTSNIFFNKMEVRIAGTKNVLPFIRTDTGNNYAKYKLTTAFLEVPLEFRFTSDPSNPNKAIKAALGLKFGAMINAHTKGVDLQNAAGTKLNQSTVKESATAYFNSTRIAATARVGYGIFSLYGSYDLTGMFKVGVAPDIRMMQIGLCISGL
jgi:hypothetical protein